jgi:hypothetical protein
MSTRDKDLQEAADALNELFGQPALDQPYQVTDIRQIVASATLMGKRKQANRQSLDDVQHA